MATTCEHEDQIQQVTSSGQGCKECVELGDQWVRLRMCLVCGHVGCCDSSKNTHATKHFHATNHAIMQSYEPGEEWGWCYIDEQMLDGKPLPHPSQSHR
ncbi:MAG: UBP-type zinc finger domain-containing protein [Herpetosiphonaceae bacterium]|nr:UBP-type zinc finger domain-containing protein [Herpetosiphonaceae bacterium]